MAKTIIVIKVDPILRRMVRMPIKPSTAGVRRLIGSSEISARVLIPDIGNGDSLAVGSRVNVDRAHPFKEWRIRGGDNTVGIGILFGLPIVRTKAQAIETGQALGTRLATGMWHCPVDVEWLERRIVWCEPGEDAPAAEIAADMGVPAGDGCAHHQEEGEADGLCAPGEDE